MQVTDGKGVDVVINSTSGELLQETWQHLATLGRFVEIGKRDIVNNSMLGMNKFEESVTFAAIGLGNLSAKKPHVIKRVLDRVMDLFEQKLISVVSPITSFPYSEI